jgi:hypothetical protein
MVKVVVMTFSIFHPATGELWLQFRDNTLKYEIVKQTISYQRMSVAAQRKSAVR